MAGNSREAIVHMQGSISKCLLTKQVLLTTMKMESPPYKDLRAVDRYVCAEQVKAAFDSTRLLSNSYCNSRMNGQAGVRG